MTISTCMKRHVVFIPEDTTIGEAAAVMVKKHIGILPVVDDSHKPVGIIRLDDLLTLELPDFIHLVKDVDFVHDFGAVETTRPERELLEQPVTKLMESVETVAEDSGLLRVYTTMLQDGKFDLPVVDSSGKLVGIVSRVDIGTAVLSLWPSGSGE